MKDCLQWNPVYGWEDFASKEDRRISRPATGAPILFRMPLLIKLVCFFSDLVAAGSAFTPSFSIG